MQETRKLFVNENGITIKKYVDAIKCLHKKTTRNNPLISLTKLTKNKVETNNKLVIKFSIIKCIYKIFPFFKTINIKNKLLFFRNIAAYLKRV